MVSCEATSLRTYLSNTKVVPDHSERKQIPQSVPRGGVKMDTTRVAPIKPTISLDVLEKIDVRVGTVEQVNDIPQSDKLVKLTVDFGDHKRNIVVGMKRERQNPKEIEGTQALFVVNLEPKRMMGETSEGVLFDIGYADGLTPVLAVPEKAVPNGVRAG
jgi:tRNA-binding protein